MVRSPRRVDSPDNRNRYEKPLVTCVERPFEATKTDAQERRDFLFNREWTSCGRAAAKVR